MSPNQLIFFSAICGLAGVSAACGTSPSASRYDDLLRCERRAVEVEIDEGMARVCGLPTDLAYFEEGSDWLDDRDKSTVHRLALCMKHGALRDRQILVTGYTDQLGEADDNDRLGLMRGMAIAAELRTHGVASERIYIRSRGEKAARGETGAARERERKVVLSLVERES